jgi:hypothetical protein
MKQRAAVLLSLFIAFNLIASSSTSLFAQCGVERWSVKTGTDPDAGLVNLNASTNTTIANLASLPAPSPIPANNRVQPTETTVWVVNATLTKYKLESDSDYHLVIDDGAGHTMIAEVPIPSCVGSGSPFAGGISTARAEVDARLSVTTSFQTASIPVQVKGVGFFDFAHGQTGAAPNQIELHPVLDIIFNPSTSADFSIAASPSSLSIAQGSSATSSISTSITGSFNSAVTLSASGLPSGTTASFSPTTIGAPGSGSSTMTVTVGASTATGSYTITVTGSGGGKTHTTSISLTVTSGGASQQLLLNPGFESGNVNWTATSGVITNSTSEAAHGGTWKAWMDGYGTTHTDTLLQTVTIPSTATSATLTFWLHIDSAETTTTTAYDTMKVQIRNSSGTVLSTLATYSNLNKATGYSQKSFNLLSFKGQTIQLFFTATEDSTLQTSFVVDDTAITVR